MHEKSQTTFVLQIMAHFCSLIRKREKAFRISDHKNSHFQTPLSLLLVEQFQKFFFCFVPVLIKILHTKFGRKIIMTMV